MGDLPRNVNVVAPIPKYQRTDCLHRTRSWLVLFSVKFSFLSFFNQLVDRLSRLLLLWRVVIVINVIAFGCCFCYAFLECPYSNIAACEMPQ